jgi:hypothetical protein
VSYHPLTTESGSDSTARRAEADRLLRMIDECPDFITLASARELAFTNEIRDNRPITAKMLFWLRDVKDKYCL